MIIANLKGGLGNQMFQYACGKAILRRNLSRGLPQELKLDATGYARIANADTPRLYGLSAFAVTAPLAADEEIRNIKYPYGAASKALRLFRAKVLRQFNTHFIPSILERSGDIYLDGFWQSEKYFADIAAEIREDFSLKEKLGAGAEEIARQVAAEKNPVSLHVRRGDYVSVAKTNASFGTCSPEYYRKAIILIRAKAPDARFFVFSDDIPWAKENLDLGSDAVFVSGTEDIRDSEEIILMSKCRHHVIANSSFSWWGAWLDPNPQKTVIAPLRWFNGSPRNYRDIVPDSWIKI